MKNIIEKFKYKLILRNKYNQFKKSLTESGYSKPNSYIMQDLHEICRLEGIINSIGCKKLNPFSGL